MPIRRYEMLLPLAHNDGTPVNPEKHSRTCEEIADKFGAYSVFPYTVRGVWVHESQRYEDHSLRLTTDVEDSPENRQFFAEFKLVLRERFEQVEIYVVSYPIEVL
jgi:hypothetical protein